MNQSTASKSFQSGYAELRKGNPAAAIPYLNEAIQDRNLIYAPAALKYATALVNNNTIAEVNFWGETFKFALCRENLGLSIHHADGRFFEAKELSCILDIVPRRANIVDVGANVGNHVVFYLGMMAPSLVIPVEPVMTSVELLRENLNLNGFKVDERGFGLAAAKQSGQLTVQAGHRDLVEARIVDDPEAPFTNRIRSAALDELVPERVDFLKVDVEGFELSVLQGAYRILSEDKPLLMIEAADGQYEKILNYLGQFKYRTICNVAGIGYKNYFLKVLPG